MDDEPKFSVTRTPEGHMTFAVPVGAVNWTKIIELIVQYGPQILQVILSLLQKNPPTPPIPNRP